MKLFTAALALCCALHISLACAAPLPWQALSPSEQVALAPIYQQWNNLPETQQTNLRHIAQHYADLNADGKHRFSSRLSAWAQLTPAQRQAAREKYRAFSQIPAEKREQIKQMVKQNQALKAQQAASAVPVVPTPVSAPTITPP
jgi:hypothetical protein